MEEIKGQNKGQKLASAIYFVTSFFDEKEPLKWQLRSLSLDLSNERLRDKSLLVREAIIYFDLAKTVGIISDTNHNILVKEFSKFSKESENSLVKLFFESEELEERRPMPLVREIMLRDKIEKKLETEPKSLKDFGLVSVKKNGRQSIIIALLKRKKEITINDAASLIADCSEKTIQRELLAMVESGVLKKIGEKRWSRYSLA